MDAMVGIKIELPHVIKEHNFIRHDHEQATVTQPFKPYNDLDDVKIKLESIIPEEIDIKDETLVQTPPHTDKRLECHICKKKFGTKYDLIRHIRTHTGEKPYQCQLCNKTFGDGSTLRAHMTTHTKNKPYECKICKKKFTRSNILKQHIKKHK